MSMNRRPHKDALFLLKPMNGKARDVVRDPDNSHFFSPSLQNNEVASFDIGFHINSQSSIYTLATFGRYECDITLRPSSISRTHCSFEVDDPNSGTIMLHDRSPWQKTRVSGGDRSESFDVRRPPRKILVHPGFNTSLSMGGKNGDLIEFQLQWIKNEKEIKSIISKQLNNRKGDVCNPRKIQTRDATGTATPEQAFQENSQTGIRYFKRDLRGDGSFGKVWRVIDIDTGRVMAMKQFCYHSQQQKQVHFVTVRREVELMRRAEHVRLSPLVNPLVVAHFEVVKHYKLNHIPGLGGRVFLY